MRCIFKEIQIKMNCAFMVPRVLFISSVNNVIYEQLDDEENTRPS
jgi:hypothetical protein